MRASGPCRPNVQRPRGILRESSRQQCSVATGVSERFRQTIGQDPLRYDLTEISGLDYLSSSSGVIAEAQQLAAKAFGADHTWFLVNGCTAGIHAAVMACAGPGDTLLVARNCHLSVFSAMVLSGCQPWWIAPELDTEFGVAHGVQPAALRQALRGALAAGARVRGAMVVSPTYFGAVAPIQELASICHEHGIPLLVDEAHGAHFGTHPGLPPSALSQGADCAIHSTHKVLSAMTQAAMLHTQGSRLDPNRVSRALQVLQSSSPSYLLMASLDAARAMIGEPGFLDQPLAAALYARNELQQIQGVRLLGSTTASSSHPRPQEQDALNSLAAGSSSNCTTSSSSSSNRGSGTGSTGSTASGANSSSSSNRSSRGRGSDIGSSGNAASAANSSSSSSSSSSTCGSQQVVDTDAASCTKVSERQLADDHDPMRITLGVWGLGMTGFQVASQLEQTYNVVVELATSKVVVSALGPGTSMAHATSLVHAFQSLSKKLLGAGDSSNPGSSSSSSSSSLCTASTMSSNSHVASMEGGSSSCPPPADGTLLPQVGPQASCEEMPQAAMTPRAAFFAATVRVAAAAAVGRVSAELLCPYPPGVPVLFPGEVITTSALAQLREALGSGGAVTGAGDPTLNTILVVADDS